MFLDSEKTIIKIIDFDYALIDQNGFQDDKIVGTVNNFYFYILY